MLTRRGLLARIAAAGAAPLAGCDLPLARAAGSNAAERIAIRATPISHFVPRRPDQTRFGTLTFRGGLTLRADHRGFGGLSGLARESGTGRITAINDNGYWLMADAVYAEGRLAGLDGAVMAPMLDQRGRPIHATAAYDSEGLALTDGIAFVSFERIHEVMRFDLKAEGVTARGQPLRMPAELRNLLPSNKSLEAVGVVPRGQPFAGAVVTIAERSGRDDEPTSGFILGAGEPVRFRVRRFEGYDITDLAFLPEGDMLLLERRASLAEGIGMRIRRIAAGGLKRDALLDGPVLIEADLESEIDNMEGLAVHRDGSGRTILSLVSDDNFAFYQRSVLLEFELG